MSKTTPESNVFAKLVTNYADHKIGEMIKDFAKRYMGLDGAISIPPEIALELTRRGDDALSEFKTIIAKTTNNFTSIGNSESQNTAH